MKSIKEIIEAHTNEEGQIDFDKADAVYQKNINDIVAAKTDPDKLAVKAVEQIASELGVEASNVDDLKLWAKKMGGNTDEFKEANMKLEKELEAERKTREDIENQFKETQNEYRVKDQMAQIKSLGVDDERAEFLHYKLNKQVGEDKDFDAVLGEYTKENADEFRKESTSFRKRRDPLPTDTDDDVLRAWEQKYDQKK